MDPNNVEDLEQSLEALRSVHISALVAKPPPGADKVQEEKRKRTFSYSELHESKDEIQRFLIPDLLPAQAVALLLGEDGVGKSQLCIQLALSIAFKQQRFLGQPLQATRPSALVIATEDSRQKFTSACTKQAYAMHPGHDPASVGIYFTEGSDFDDWQEMTNEIEAHLKVTPTELVVTDVLSDLFSFIDGEINSNKDARKIMNYFQGLCTKYGCTVIIIHHVAKTKVVEMRKNKRIFLTKNDSQGAGAITQKPRTVIALSNDPASGDAEGAGYDNFIHVVKANLMGKHFMKNALQVQFHNDTLLHTATGMVSMELYEEDPGNCEVMPVNARGGGITGKLDPAQLAMERHVEIMKSIYADKKLLQRTELVTRLMQGYSVGKSAIEKDGGYITYLTAKGLLERSGRGVFRFTHNGNGAASNGEALGAWEPLAGFEGF